MEMDTFHLVVGSALELGVVFLYVMFAQPVCMYTVRLKSPRITLKL